ncbi:MAG: anti-sigma regulatory factor [Anaerolineae bacterium]|nr:anti-sigma regulatory factor [Anaerolineae bacterium]
MSSERVVPIRGDMDIVAARIAGRELARELGFGLVDQARIATAISELVRNIVQYAGEGEALIRALDSGPRIGIEIVLRDNGPGIADVQQALRDGFSTSGHLGMGLPGARRLMDEFAIESQVAVGTTVTIRKWRR